MNLLSRGALSLALLTAAASSFSVGSTFGVSATATAARGADYCEKTCSAGVVGERCRGSTTNTALHVASAPRESKSTSEGEGGVDDDEAIMASAAAAEDASSSAEPEPRNRNIFQSGAYDRPIVLMGCSGPGDELMRLARSLSEKLGGSGGGAGVGGTFFDPFTKAAVGQFRADDAARVEAEERAAYYVADLLEVDREIDGHRAYNAAVESLGPMYRVDRFVDGNRGRSARTRGVDAIAELLAVDRQIDASRRRTKAEGSVGAQPAEGDPMEVLLAVDRFIDGKTQQDKERAFLRGIGELVKIDRMMAKVQMPLADKLGGGNTKDKDTVEIPAPPMAPVQQGTVEGGAGRTRSIFTSAEKQSATSYEKRAMNAVSELRKVDDYVDRRKERKARGAAVEDVTDLLAVDREVDRARSVAAKKEADRAKRAAIEEAEKAPPQAAQARAEGTNVAAPAAAPKRSIFSTKEKRSATATTATKSRERRSSPAPPSVVLGSTTVVRKDGKMIGSIPVGESVGTRQAKEEFFGKERAMAKPESAELSGDDAKKDGRRKRMKEKIKGKKKDGCLIM
uniref:Uncharacterized protein n=1 Tax=Odontella aurita TaxID=265563 RepID=A0A7S4MW81_9STRA|mmetsp:Transcript_36409/g.109314  ORF Transcript_36409/g.109314 Transcript_36409/m.109314 type:complete len:567 (+) Transcript_36409:178-1878(+)